MTTQNVVNTTLSGQTGTGNFVGSDSPALVTPNLGTPSAVTLTNGTGLKPNGGLAASTLVASSSSGNFTGTSATFADITNMTATITTTGRPVLLVLSSDSDNTHAGGFFGSAAGSGVQIQVVKDGTALSPQIQLNTNQINNSYLFVDASPTAASHTYKIQYLIAAGTFSCVYMKLTVSEML